MDITAILLAAGASRRFDGGGGPARKLLAPLAGAPVVAHVARALAASRIARVVAVTRPGDRAVPAILDAVFSDAAARVGSVAGRHTAVENPDPDRGMGSSIAVGIAALAPDTRGALIVPADMPGLDALAIDRLAGAFVAAGGDAIVHAATADGQPSPPVLWPARLFPRLSALDGDIGGKLILAAERARAQGAVIAVRFADPAVLRDVDTPADLDAPN